MALKYQLDTLDGLDDGVKALYTEKDGKFVLGIEGLPQPEDTTGLKKTVEQLRAERKALEDQTKAWAQLGASPEEIQEMLAAKQKAEEEAARKKGDFDALLKQQQDKWEKDRAALIKENEALRSSERKAIIENQLVTALVKAEFTDTGLEFIPRVITDQIKIEEDGGNRVVRIYQPDGKTLMAGSGEGGMATFADLAKSLAEKYPDLVKSQMKGGAGKDPGSQQKPGSKTVSRAEWERADHAQRNTWMSEGYSLTDA